MKDGSTQLADSLGYYAVKETESTDIYGIVKRFGEQLRKETPNAQLCVQQILNSYNAVYVTDLTKNAPAAYREDAMVEDLALISPELAGLWIRLRHDLFSWAAGWLQERVENTSCVTGSEAAGWQEREAPEN